MSDYNSDVSRKYIVKTVEFLKNLKSELDNIHPKSEDVWKLIRKFNNTNKSVANILGISVSTVKRSLKNHDIIVEKKKRGPKAIECTDYIISEIRRVTLNFYARKEFPTLNTIKNACLQNSDFPQVGKDAIRKWMREKCKFSYRKINRKPVYVEREDIKIHREPYIRGSRRYRALGYKQFYIDQTWANSQIAPNYLWLCNLTKEDLRLLQPNIEEPVLQDMDGNCGGFLVKNDNGRVIVNHAGAADGFLAGAEDVFISRNKSADYHKCMNGEHFNDWFERFVALLPDKSVVVLDQAPYHKLRVPSTIMAKYSWHPDAIMENLKIRGIMVDQKFQDDVKARKGGFKKALISLSDQHPVQTKYVVQDIADKSGKDIKILWLPVAHCEFNPIELIWSFAKTDVAKNNKTSGLNNILKLTNDALAKVTLDMWKNCCDHVITYENKMWERDDLVDTNDSIVGTNVDNEEEEEEQEELEEEEDEPME